ncbi:unnamed protein product, partial [Musa textilis]
MASFKSHMRLVRLHVQNWKTARETVDRRYMNSSIFWLTFSLESRVLTFSPLLKDEWPAVLRSWLRWGLL